MQKVYHVVLRIAEGDHHHGFTRVASSSRPTVLPDSNMMTMPAEGGTTKRILGDDTIPGVTKNRVKKYALLDVPKAIVTSGERESHGTTAGISHGLIVDRIGNKHCVRFPGLITIDLVRHAVSSCVADT